MISVITSDRFLDHDTGYGHPERPERLTACLNALKKSDLHPNLNWLDPRFATEEELLWIHSAEHIANVRQMAESGGGFLDPDTPVCADSYEIALLSAGAWLAAVDEVLGDKRSAWVLSRPPGHHCERDYAMGFCLFSNCALAAHYAVRQYGIQRVAVFDWDVHHGNGSQHILEKDPQMAYVSTHQYPFYPGTGNSLERGDHDNVLNIPLPAGSGREEYINSFNNAIKPFLTKWNPDLLIISAGFDAARQDPLANMNLDAEDFAELTRGCLQIAPQLLLGLEGGYSLQALGESVVAVTRELVNCESTER